MLSITGIHAAKASEFQPLHKDLFYRMLAGQAATEPMKLMTNDKMLQAYGTFVTLVQVSPICAFRHPVRDRVR